MRQPLSLASLAVASTLLLHGLNAQDDPNVARRDAKLAAPFLKNGTWVTDYDTARERAAKEGKLIFAYFTRSFAH